VLVDIEPDTYNIDANRVTEAITPRTKVIMPVSLYGQPADLDEINDIAKSHGDIAVIEDAAQSFGATYKNRHSCNLSTFGCTSFFPSKPLGCYGDGGAIFTSDTDLADQARVIRLHGQEKRYVHTRVGVGGRMDTLQCAVILAKLEQFDTEIRLRDEVATRYGQLLADIDGLGLPTVRPDRTSVHAQYTVAVNDRDQVAASLKEDGIPTAIHYPVPLQEQPAYRDRCRTHGTLSHATSCAGRVLSLPMHPYLHANNQEKVVDRLHHYLARRA